MTDIVTLPKRAVRLRFTWMLPGLFAIGSMLGTFWPGHAGKLFCLGALAGVWVCYLVDSAGDVGAWLVPVLVGGVPILVLLGRLLDRLQADMRLWVAVCIVLAGAAGYVLLQDFAELDRAVEHHGSFLSLVVCALQLGSYGATLVLLALGASQVARR